MGPSMGLTPARCALRGQPAAVRIRSGRIRVRPIHGPHPCALRTAGPACGCPNSLRANSSNRVGFQPASHQKQETPRLGRFLFLAEREGFEPSVRLHVRLISSQVHSTTLPPLRMDRGSVRAGKFTRWHGARQAGARSGQRVGQPAFLPASRNHVSTTVSGFKDRDSMPCSINHSARSA